MYVLHWISNTHLNIGTHFVDVLLLKSKQGKNNLIERKKRESRKKKLVKRIKKWEKQYISIETNNSPISHPYLNLYQINKLIFLS